MPGHVDWMRRAVELAVENVEEGGKPFGAVLVRDGGILAEGVNEVVSTSDPTTHAEMQAIRAASKKVGGKLTGVVAYASGHPCPMCLAALYVAGVREIYFGTTLAEAAAAGFGVDEIYREVSLPNDRREVPLQRVELDGSVPNPLAAWRARNG